MVTADPTFKPCTRAVVRDAARYDVKDFRDEVGALRGRDENTHQQGDGGGTDEPAHYGASGTSTASLAESKIHCVGVPSMNSLVPR